MAYKSQGVVKRPKGRRPRSTPEQRKQLVELVAAGNYLSAAARAVGMPWRTVMEWMQRGRETGKEPYGSFFLAVREAEAKAEVRDVALIRLAARNTWQAAAWYLERKYPDRWGRRDVVKHDGTIETKNTQAVDLSLQILADPEAIGIAHDLLARLVAAGTVETRLGDSSGNGVGAIEGIVETGAVPVSGEPGGNGRGSGPHAPPDDVLPAEAREVDPDQ